MVPDLSPFEWIAGALGVGLLPLLAFLLPAEHRGRLGGPFLFWLGFAAFTLGRSQVQGQPQQVLDVLAFFCCLSFLGQEGLLLVLWFRFTSRGEKIPSVGLRGLVFLVYSLVFLSTLLYGGVPVVSTLILLALALLTLLVMFRHMLTDVAAGLVLKSQQGFARGDWVEIGGVEPLAGLIQEVNWQGTILLPSQGGEILVPNHRLLNCSVWNRSRRGPGFSQTMTVDCPVSAPPALARQALHAALTSCPGILDKPIPQVNTLEFLEGKVRYQLAFAVLDPAHAARIGSDLRNRVWCSLGRAGIPFFMPAGLESTARDLATGALNPAKKAEILRLLRNVPWFVSLSDQTLEQLGHQARLLWYAAGEVVVRQGELSTEMFVIHRGQVVVTAHGEGGGTELEVNRLGSGTCFGEMAMLTGDKRSATVRALEDCELFSFERNTLGDLLAREPELVATIRAELKKRQVQLDLFKEQSSKFTDSEKVVPGSLVDRFLQQFGLFT